MSSRQVCGVVVEGSSGELGSLTPVQRNCSLVLFSEDELLESSLLVFCMLVLYKRQAELVSSML